MTTQGGMSQIAPLALIVVVDKEPDRPPQRLQRTTKTAAPAGHHPDNCVKVSSNQADKDADVIAIGPVLVFC